MNILALGQGVLEFFASLISLAIALVLLILTFYCLAKNSRRGCRWGGLFAIASVTATVTVFFVARQFDSGLPVISFCSFAPALTFNVCSIWAVLDQLAKQQVPNYPACRYCGYNLTGLIEPRCPECGEAFDTNSRSLEIPRNRQQ